MARWQTESGRWFGGVVQTRRRGSRQVWGPRWGSRATLALLGAVSVLAAVAVTLALVSGAHAGPHSWKIISSPDPNFASGNLLSGVAALPHVPPDAWAVGITDAQTGPQTLTMHLNGTTWHYVPSPSVPGQNTILSAVSEVSTHDVWAVGFSNPGNTLTEHWNGASWSIVASPSPGAPDAFDVLNGVAALAANNVWAVGYQQRSTTSGNTTRTLIEHWNGASWSVVPSPNASGVEMFDQLSSVTAVAPNDVWAVGFYAPPSGPPCGVNPAYTLIEHWNGTSWQIVSSPNVHPGTDVNQLLGVTNVLGSGGDDLWAVGSDAPPNFCVQPPQSYTLIEHWNGTSWQVVSSANVHPGQEENFLESVAAVGPNDVWAVGSWGSLQSAMPLLPQTLIEHWNGASWSVTSSPDVQPNMDSNVLSGVAAVAPNDVWAVGNSESTTTNIQQTLTELYH
jgi:hypothetical protein